MNRNKWGSNQYQAKKKTYTKEWLAILGIAVVVCYTGRLAGQDIFGRIKTAWAQETAIISPLPETHTIKEPVPFYIDTSDVRQVTEQEEIEKYIKTIFGKDAKTAIAISHKECNPKNKAYPKCVLSTEREHSVGIFQINIQSHTAKVHSARIPGDTLEEKETWLKNPKNNTLMAYWIFEKSGWNPWSVYKNGSYLEEM